jgi:hypothetical protein
MGAGRLLGRSEQPVVPPITGRPSGFTGAVGTFRVSARVAPKQVQVECPMTLTIRIEGKGNLNEIQRPNLRAVSSLTKRFHITDGSARDLARDSAREFDYALRPRTDSVKEIPPMPFVYFKPGMTPAELGYQTTYTRAIPLTVLPASASNGLKWQHEIDPAEAPEEIFRFTALSLPDDELVAKARAAFQAGLAVRQDSTLARPLFVEAAEACGDIVGGGCHDASIYKSEGNAWLLAGDLPRAILAYRQGLVHDPANRPMQACLEYARDQVVYHHPDNLGRPPSASPRWLLIYGLPASTLGWLMVASWAVALLMFVYWRCSRMHQLSRLLLSVSAVLFALVPVFALVLIFRVSDYHQAQAESVVVVSQDGIVLRVGNGLSYLPKYQTALNQGVEARLLFTRGDWLQIELLTGEAGWVPRQAVVQ